MADFTLLASGEGPTDIGDEWAGELKPGPMLEMARKILEETPVGNLPLEQVKLLKEGDIQRESEQLRNRNRRFFLQRRGPDDREMGLFRRNAQTLGYVAARDGYAVAILFHDADRTRTSRADDWQKKVDSIENGFLLADYDRGVAMVPRPVSEAWLLAMAQPDGNVAGYEDLPGNDASTNHPKKKLESLGFAGREQLLQLVIENFVPGHITMPSLQRFEERLRTASALWYESIS